MHSLETSPAAMNAVSRGGILRGNTSLRTSCVAYALPTGLCSGYRNPPHDITCNRSRLTPRMAVSSKSRTRAVAKRHAAAAMRGLSDTAGVVVLHELWHATVAAAAGGSVAGVAEACVAFGGLAGVWSAALAVRLVRAHARFCAEKARRIADDWDRSFLYYGAGQQADDADDDVAVEDVSAVIAWMDALEELESPHGARLLWELARSDHAEKRCALAQALSSCENLQSNVVIGVLATLVRDKDVAVSEAATKTLRVVVRSNGGLAIDEPQTKISTGGGASVESSRSLVAGSATNDDSIDYVITENRTRQQLNAVLQETIASEKTKVLASAPRSTSSLAYDNTEKGVVSDDLWQEDVTKPCIIQKRFSDAMHVEAPLFDWLATAELRYLCLVASVPLAYELFYITSGVTGGDGLRFVGLGWLMGIAGLLAYPRSDTIWLKVEEQVVVDSCEC